MALPFWTRRYDIGFEGDLYSANPEELVSIGKLKLPGISKFKAAPKVLIDLQKVNGKDGAVPVLRGYMPGPIEIETLIWTPSQWTVMQSVISAVWTKPGKIATNKISKGKAATLGAAAAQRAALDIDHPYATLFGIKSVVIEGISPPEEGPSPQTRLIRFHCIEYAPPSNKDATAVVKGSGPKVGVESDAALQPKNKALAPSETDASFAAAKTSAQGGT